MAPNIKELRCAIYTRVSTDAGLEQDFNSLDAQREAAEAFIKSQAHEGWRPVRTAYDDGGYSGGNMDRPALRQLLEDLKAGLIDIIVVYKVDRLTRSLADFAKLVEQFDARGASFVSVTQAFNTTSSMGRLTLNVLLSFAQFEREVTGERIRDKIDASKKKGIWMGGWVPLGYRARDRKLHVDPTEAETVRLIFRLYLELRSIPRLLEELNRRGVRTRARQTTKGVVGDIPYTAGPVAYLLRNRIYLGEIAHRTARYSGEHEAILDAATFEAAQALLTQNGSVGRRKPCAGNAPLAGRIFDDCGNRMGPTYGRKAGRIVRRVSAPDVESSVSCALRKALGKPHLEPDVAFDYVERVVVRKEALILQLSASKMEGEKAGTTVLEVPWNSAPRRKRKAVTLPGQDVSRETRTIRSDRRAKLLEAAVKGRAWLKELLTGCVRSYAEIAAREKRSERSVAMKVSLAFLAPDILEAAISGSLPRGIGMTRLMELPASWNLQRQELGLT